MYFLTNVATNIDVK